jgi:hypothetical protein
VPPSEYELRYVCSHLVATDRAADLYRVARNRSFIDAQRVSFPDEPDVGLSTLRYAILEAARNEDLADLIDFCVRHLQLLISVRSQSPIDAAMDGTIQRAWQIADYEPPDRRGVWHAVIAFWCVANGRSNDAWSTCARLPNAHIVVVEPGRFLDTENFLNTILGYVLDLTALQDEALARKIACHLLPDWQAERRKGSYESMRSAHDDYQPGERERPAYTEAWSLAMAGKNVRAAAAALRRIPFDGYGFRTRASLAVVSRLISDGAYTSACRLIGEAMIPLPESVVFERHRVVAGARVAERLAKAGLTVDAGDLLAALISAAKAIGDAQERFLACDAVAVASLVIFGLSEARLAIDKIMGPSDYAAKAAIFPNLAQFLVERGDLDAAERLLLEIKEPTWTMSFRNRGVAGIARALAMQGRFDAARKAAQSVQIQTFESDVEMQGWSDLAEATAPAAIAQAERGDLSAAWATIEPILHPPAINNFGAGKGFIAAVSDATMSILLCSIQHSRFDIARQAAESHFRWSFRQSSEQTHKCLLGILRKLEEDTTDSVRSATNDVQLIPDSEWRVYALVAIAHSRQAIADSALRNNTLSRAEVCARTLESFAARVTALTTIGNLQQKLGFGKSLESTVADLIEAVGLPEGKMDAGATYVLTQAMRLRGVQPCRDMIPFFSKYPLFVYTLCESIADMDVKLLRRVAILVATHTWVDPHS